MNCALSVPSSRFCCENQAVSPGRIGFKAGITGDSKFPELPSQRHVNLEFLASEFEKCNETDTFVSGNNQRLKMLPIIPISQEVGTTQQDS